ncbi:MAG: hypothetical protein QXS20_01550 [Candidatus Thorarchaeota archaeon]
MSNIIVRKQASSDLGEEVYTRKLLDLNTRAREAVREFALHDVDDMDGLESRRIAMHDAFTMLHSETARFNEEMMGEEFDIAYLKERIKQAEGETKAQLENAVKELQTQAERNRADIWMSRVMAWLHQATASSGPFVDEENEEKKRNALGIFSTVIMMLDRPFAAVPDHTDGTMKLRKIALGSLALDLMMRTRDAKDPEVMKLRGYNKIAEAEFHDEFLHELVNLESTFRQAFNPFDEIVWRDILSSYIFEQAADLYNEAIDALRKAGVTDQIDAVQRWKQNAAGLSEVYNAMTYADIADVQMRAGNLEDAAKLYQTASDAFGRAQKMFASSDALEGNARQSAADRDHRRAQSLFCKSEAAFRELAQLLSVDNREEAEKVLDEIFKDLGKAEKLSKSRELTGAIRENLKILSFVQTRMKNSQMNPSGIIDQIELAKSIRKEGLIQDVNRAVDSAQNVLVEKPADSLDFVRSALTSLGILLSLEREDEQVEQLRNRVLAVLANLKYVIQFQVSSQLQQGFKFIVSRVLENLNAEEAARFYSVVHEDKLAEQLRDLGKLAMATACSAEAQSFARQAEQWAFRTHLERSGVLQLVNQEPVDEARLEEVVKRTLESHDNTARRIRHAIACFEAASAELGGVVSPDIRKKNNVDDQIKQLQGVALKFKGDLSRIEGAKEDFMAEFLSRRKERIQARQYYSRASDRLREAVGNYTVAAQVFQQLGDQQAAENVFAKASTADLLARGIWDNGQRLGLDKEPVYKTDAELFALYLATAGK